MTIVNLPVYLNFTSQYCLPQKQQTLLRCPSLADKPTAHKF